MDRQVKKAILRYNDGERPWRHVEKNWFVLDDSGNLYPAKYLWALAISASPPSFNTATARRELAARGCHLVDRAALIALEEDDEARVTAALGLSDEELQKHLKGTGAPPERHLAVTHRFTRNPYVAAATLRRADGQCEECKCPAPFNRASDGRPYLEVHHRKFLSEGGKDSLENTMALCPNCHREAHYG